MQLLASLTPTPRGPASGPVSVEDGVLTPDGAATAFAEAFEKAGAVPLQPDQALSASVARPADPVPGGLETPDMPKTPVAVDGAAEVPVEALAIAEIDIRKAVSLTPPSAPDPAPVAPPPPVNAAASGETLVLPAEAQPEAPVAKPASPTQPVVSEKALVLPTGTPPVPAPEGAGSPPVPPASAQGGPVRENGAARSQAGPAMPGPTTAALAEGLLTRDSPSMQQGVKDAAQTSPAPQKSRDVAPEGGKGAQAVTAAPSADRPVTSQRPDAPGSPPPPVDAPRTEAATRPAGLQPVAVPTPPGPGAAPDADRRVSRSPGAAREVAWPSYATAATGPQTDRARTPGAADAARLASVSAHHVGPTQATLAGGLADHQRPPLVAVGEVLTPEVLVLDGRGGDARLAVEPASHRPEAPRSVMWQLGELARRLPDGPIEVSLSPEELGRVRLSLQAADGGMVVQIAAERSETLDLIRRNIDLLAQELRDQGYSELSFAFGQGQGGGNSAPSGGGSDDPGSVAPDLVTDPIAPIARMSVAAGLDIRI